MRQSALALVCVVLSPFAIPPFAISAGAADYQVTVVEGKHADVVAPNGETILRYMFERDSSTAERTFDTAKVFAHVMAPGGKETITKGAGGKFPHHRGIFIGWNRIKQDGKRHDLWHVRNTLQKHEEFLKNESGQDGAAITSKIVWIGVDKKPLIEEVRTYRVQSADDCYALIDFTSKLTAVGGDLTLDGDPEHAGVQFRPSQKVAENGSATYVFHEDGVNPKKQRDLPWVASSFKVGDQQWTVQNMSHPSNPKGAIWSAYRDYGRFGPFTVIDIKDGESIELKYRFRVTEGGAPERDAMAEQFGKFAQ